MLPRLMASPRHSGAMKVLHTKHKNRRGRAPSGAAAFIILEPERACFPRSEQVSQKKGDLKIMIVNSSILRIQRSTPLNLLFYRVHDFVMRKLSSVYPITQVNFFKGNAIIRISSGTRGRAEGSKMPSITLGFSFCFSSHG